MEDVLLLRRFEAPITLDALMARLDRFKWCFEVHETEHRQSYVSLDGRSAVCLFKAPEAEALRTTMRQLDVPTFEVWPVTVHLPSKDLSNDSSGGASASAAAGDPDCSLVIVERRFDTPVEFEKLQAVEDHGAWCLDLYQVRFLATYFSRDRRSMVCIYRAPDAESVRNAQSQIGMPFERAWPAIAYAAAVSAD